MPLGYRINTITLIMNLFDTIGRFLPNFIKIKRTNLPILILLRSFFVFSFPILTLIERNYETSVSNKLIL